MIGFQEIVALNAGNVIVGERGRVCVCGGGGGYSAPWLGKNVTQPSPSHSNVLLESLPPFPDEAVSIGMRPMQ